MNGKPHYLYVNFLHKNREYQRIVTRARYKTLFLHYSRTDTRDDESDQLASTDTSAMHSEFECPLKAHDPKEGNTM